MKRDLDKVITKNEQFVKIRNSLQDKIKKLENENLVLGQNQRDWKMMIEREKKLTIDEQNLKKRLNEFIYENSRMIQEANQVQIMKEKVLQDINQVKILKAET